VTAPTRRGLLIATAGAGALGTLGALGVGRLIGGADLGSPVLATSDAVARAEAARRGLGQRTVAANLVARPLTVDLGGVVVDTWAYGDTVPGPVLRARAGDLVRVVVDNQLETGTSVHWHGLALRNDMDGVPGMTQDPVAAGGRFTYEFTAPDPGTYFYHPHSGVQLDRGLYGALVVDDPAEPGDYDQEWIVVLDDWVDGTGRSPDQVLDQLLAAEDSGGIDHGGMDMGGMDHGSMGMDGGMQSALLGGAGDVDHPHHLLNGRIPEDPVTLRARPGQRVRVRVINAGSDTAYRIALGGHRMTVTHSDGFPVHPADTDALLIGMGERYDVLVTLGDGAFPLFASAEGKQGHGLAVVRTGSAAIPSPVPRPAELDGLVLTGTDLTGAAAARLPARSTDRVLRLALAGSMAPYRWTINGSTFADADPLPVTEGERVRLRFENHSMMFHPVHVHGHTFGLARGGARKDTVIVRPMRALEVDLDADNPGQWATHCHNIYHAEAGMMTTLSYRA
jgi:FtsP/CotA-like multicopper oxidase with cupredoxin domain